MITQESCQNLLTGVRETVSPKPGAIDLFTGMPYELRLNKLSWFSFGGGRGGRYDEARAVRVRDWTNFPFLKAGEENY